MALAMGPAKLATTSHSRLQMSCSSHSVTRIATLPASDFLASQLCLCVKDARMVVTDGRKLVAVPRAAAAATMAQSRTRISDTFVKLKQQGKVALIPYLTAGDPSLDTTAEAMRVLDACGADIIEVGVPYTDPLADGPVIQAAATRSLAQGTTLDKVLAMVREVTPTLGAPVVLFTYYNPILKRGPETFLKAVKEAGASGLVVPDLPLEETGKLRELSTANGLELILLTTPTTPQERMEVIARASQGFVYLVSLTGVTGARLSVQSRVEKLLKELKQVTDMPIAVGFGISKPEHATLVARWGADGVIVGSAMVKILGEAANPKDGLAALEQFTRDLKASLSKCQNFRCTPAV